MTSVVTYLVRSAVDNVELSELHQAAFGSDQLEVLPWRDRLEAHSLTWVQAFDAGRLVGFVNVAWDGGAHAFLLDTIVERERRHQGIGIELVRQAAGAAQETGCAWLHVDYEPHLAAFYVDSCGFRPTAAGLLRLFH